MTIIDGWIFALREWTMSIMKITRSEFLEHVGISEFVLHVDWAVKTFLKKFVFYLEEAFDQTSSVQKEIKSEVKAVEWPDRILST